MTNVETRLQRELPIVADAILAQPAQPAIVPESRTRPAVRALLVAAAAVAIVAVGVLVVCLLYTSPSPRDKRQSRMPSSA